jgi:hypothetical protein
MAKLVRSLFPGYEKWEVAATKKQSAIDASNSGKGTHSVDDHDLKEVRKISGDEPLRMHPDSVKELNKQAHNSGIIYKKVAEPETDEEYAKRIGEPAKSKKADNSANTAGEEKQ